MLCEAAAAVTINIVYCKGLGEIAMLTLSHVLMIGTVSHSP